MLVKMFKAKKQTRRFNKNQKVWITKDSGNYVHVRFKYRGKGRYVSGRLAKLNYTNKANFNLVIGEDGFKDIEVGEDFAKRLGINNS